MRQALIAEDNDINALIAEKALRRLGFEPVRATGGEEAVRMAAPLGFDAAGPFDLILMDLKMPGIDGFEATRRVRRHEAAAGVKRTPIVALTANGLGEERRTCEAAGFDAFLVKPFDFDVWPRRSPRCARPADLRRKHVHERHNSFGRKCFGCRASSKFVKEPEWR